MESGEAECPSMVAIADGVSSIVSAAHWAQRRDDRPTGTRPAGGEPSINLRLLIHWIRQQLEPELERSNPSA